MIPRPRCSGCGSSGSAVPALSRGRVELVVQGLECVIACILNPTMMPLHHIPCLKFTEWLWTPSFFRYQHSIQSRLVDFSCSTSIATILALQLSFFAPADEEHESRRSTVIRLHRPSSSFKHSDRNYLPERPGGVRQSQRINLHRHFAGTASCGRGHW